MYLWLFWSIWWRVINGDSKPPNNVSKNIIFFWLFIWWCFVLLIFQKLFIGVNVSEMCNYLLVVLFHFQNWFYSKISIFFSLQKKLRKLRFKFYLKWCKIINVTGMVVEISGHFRYISFFSLNISLNLEFFKHSLVFDRDFELPLFHISNFGIFGHSC